MPQTLCNILGTISDTSGTGVTGKLKVVLTAPFTVDSTTPDTYLTPIEKEYVCTLGAINITLRETETVQIPYRFRYYLSIGGGEYSTTPLFDFYALVPDVASVQFSSLVPTGITPDRISTGALRVAKLILSDPTLTDTVIQAVGIFRSPTTPTPTGNNDVWVKSDDGSLWVWDEALSNWLSEPVTVNCGIFKMPETTDVLAEIPAYFGKVAARLTRVDFRTKVNTTNTGSNYWRFQAGYQLQGNSSIDQIGLPSTTAASAANTIVKFSIQPDEYIPFGTGATPVEYLGLQLTKVGSPGTVNASATFTLRYLYS